jgi:sugar/nucleoside kinase (ribokinase family)
MSLDVLAVGNAIVDVLVHADDDLLDALGMEKGAMQLVDAERSAELYDRIGPAVEVSGGSAANTAAGVASLGGTVAFAGKVADDQLGEVFAHDLRSTGVRFDVTPRRGTAPTARSLILVTPDAQRTMNTYLGVAAEIGADDVDTALLREASITFIEGYLVGVPAAQGAVDKVLSTAGRVALTLSDSFWVENMHAAFVELVPRLELVFANEREACALYRTDDLDEAVRQLAKAVPAAVVTRSEKGSVVLRNGDRVDVPAEPVSVVDTTGAGDLYAAGFLYGYTHGAPPEICGRLGAAAAAEVISHVGARPVVALKDHVDPAWL